VNQERKEIENMPGPLEGVRVLSFARNLAGPYCTMILCDLGAEVIKIEEAENGDTARSMGPYLQGISSYFLSVNRGQKSVALNLREDQAKDVVFKLVEETDVIVENFRPGVIERLGFGYQTVAARNPRVVYASISGFGQKGPYRTKPAYDMVAQGMGGGVSITGEPDRPPVRVGFSIGDLGAGLFAAVAILAALHECAKSGRGQWIDVAMVDCQIALCENALARYLATGQIPTPLGTRHPLLAPFQIFPTKDSYIVLITVAEEDWQKFCKISGREDLRQDTRFRVKESRIENYRDFEPLMNDLMKSKSTA
jgi:CoA:oxalate CoA-transferase